MSIGRNDSCPCGSGKKYKKCCLAKDEEAARKKAIEGARPKTDEAAGAVAERKERPKPAPDPLREAWDARWEEFDTGDYEERIALFTRTLNDEPELMDGEMAFEMLNELFVETAKRGERDRFDALVESLRARLPEVYEKEAHWLLDWGISNALAARRDKQVAEYALELGLMAHKQIDIWNQVEGRLAYYGRLDALVGAMRAGWPKVRQSRDILPWGIDEFCVRGAQYEYLYYLTQTAAPDARDPALLERVKFFYGDEIDVEQLAVTLDCLSGRMERQWTLDDFKRAPAGGRTRRDEDEELSTGEINLISLTQQFAGYAHRVEGVSYAKAELARRGLYSYIVEQQAGELEYQEGFLDAPLRSSGRRHKPIKKFQRVEHPLCPNRERLDKFLAIMLDFLAPRYFGAAALVELTPAWLRFLERQGLIDSALHQQVLRDLARLGDDLRKVFDDYTPDPALGQAMAKWEAEIAPAPLLT